MRVQKFVTFLIVFVLSAFYSEAKKDSAGRFVYQIEGAGVATQGDYLVRLTLTTKDKNIGDAELCRAAVHGVLFRGFTDPGSRQFQKPIAAGAANEAQHADFYESFFGKDGTAANYANMVSGSRSVVKSGKEYCVSAVIAVHKEILIKFLTDAGVIKGLNSAF